MQSLSPRCSKVCVLWHQEGGLSSGKLCPMTLSSSRVGHPVGWISIPSISQVPWTLAPFPASPPTLIEQQAAARTHTFCGPSTCSRVMGTESEVTFLVWDSLIRLFNPCCSGMQMFCTEAHCGAGRRGKFYTLPGYHKACSFILIQQICFE